MAYPKEVIVDYFLEDSIPLFEIDFRKLEWRKLQAESKKLLKEWAQIELEVQRLNLRTAQGRADYWQKQNRLDRIMSKLDCCSKKQNVLLGINTKVSCHG